MAKIDINSVLADVQKLYPKDKKSSSMLTTGDNVKTTYTDADVIKLPAGHPLRELIGLPGIPFNKVIQVAGKPGTGKTTWSVEAMAAAQAAGHTVVLFDAEAAFDPYRFKLIGGDPTQVALIKTNEILKGGELGRKIIQGIKSQDSNAKILFVWDSVGGSQSRSHAERELDNEKHAQPGQDAKENGSLMKVLVALINKYPDSIAVYLANQTYAKIGFMQHGDATSGGAKVEYHSDIIIMLKKIKTLTKTVKGVITKYGIMSRATVSKNRISQGLTSIHQLDFTITAEGCKLSDSVSDEDIDEE